MPDLIIEKYIAAPVEIVFDLSSDVHGWADCIDGIERVEVLTDGPVGVGTRFRETRVLFKKEATEELEITAFDRPHGYVVEAESCGSRYRTEMRFAPSREGTGITMTFRSEPLSFLAKVLSFVMRPFLKMIAKQIENDLDDLKRFIEVGEAGSPPQRPGPESHPDRQS